MAWQRQKADNEAQCDGHHVAGDTGSRGNSGTLASLRSANRMLRSRPYLWIAVLRMIYQIRFALQGRAKDRRMLSKINAEE